MTEFLVLPWWNLLSGIALVLIGILIEWQIPIDNLNNNEEILLDVAVSNASRSCWEIFKSKFKCRYKLQEKTRKKLTISYFLFVWFRLFYSSWMMTMSSNEQIKLLYDSYDSWDNYQLLCNLTLVNRIWSKCCTLTGVIFKIKKEYGREFCEIFQNYGSILLVSIFTLIFCASLIPSLIIIMFTIPMIPTHMCVGQWIYCYVTGPLMVLFLSPLMKDKYKNAKVDEVSPSVYSGIFMLWEFVGNFVVLLYNGDGYMAGLTQAFSQNAMDNLIEGITKMKLSGLHLISILF